MFRAIPRVIDSETDLACEELYQLLTEWVKGMQPFTGKKPARLT
jgi:hypothetical protein